MSRWPEMVALLRGAYAPRSFAMGCRPPEPASGSMVFYRGWEAGYEAERGFWTPEGYAAYKGGVDLDAPQVHASTWEGLLEAIDDEEDQ